MSNTTLPVTHAPIVWRRRADAEFPGSAPLAAVAIGSGIAASALGLCVLIVMLAP